MTFLDDGRTIHDTTVFSWKFFILLLGNGSTLSKTERGKALCEIGLNVFTSMEF